MQKLIVIEGLDGSGKATQAQLLFKSYLERGIRARKISFPDYASPSSALVKMYLGGEFGNLPEDVNPFAASSFYAVDRYASFKLDWEKDWCQGLVIADRYTTSNAIHQCSKLNQCEWDSYLEWLFKYEYELLEIPAPNLVVYLKVDPIVSQRLLKERYEGQDRRDIHEKNLGYLTRCHAVADYCARKLGWKTIDCIENNSMRPADRIAADLLSITEQVLQD